jgi:hypothetical protein
MATAFGNKSIKIGNKFLETPKYSATPKDLVIGCKQYPETPSVNTNTWADNGYNVVLKSSDSIHNSDLWNLFTKNNATHYHSGNFFNTSSPFNYTGATTFKGVKGVVNYVDLGRSIYLRNMSFLGITNNGAMATASPGIFKIYASNTSASWTDTNHASWTEIHSQTTPLTYVNNRFINFGNFSTINTPYRYFAMVVYNLNGSYGWLILGKWDIYGTYDNFKRYPETPSINANNWIDKGYNVACKSSDPILGIGQDVYFLFYNSTTPEHYHSNPLFNASTPFRYNGTTSFKGTTGMVTYLDLGRSIYLRNMKIAPRDNVLFTHLNFLTGCPGIFKIYASNNSACWNDNNHSTWTEVHSQTTALTFNYNRFVEFGNFSSINTPYRYFALVVYNLTGNYQHLMMSQWNVFGLDDTLPTIKNTDTDSDYLVFKNSGEDQQKYVVYFPEPTICDMLIVAGGGAGGKGLADLNRGAGGGGAGGLVYISSFSAPSGYYTINVGRGGFGPSVENGKDSSIIGPNSTFTYTAYGGGAGATANQSSTTFIAGNNGGSGGGGSDFNGNGGNTTQKNLYTVGSFGNNGGGSKIQGFHAGGSGGGGGGAGGIGETINGYTPGLGGAGLTFDITSTNVTYATGGDGGLAWGFNAKPVLFDSGNGGQGAGRNGTRIGGHGGSGIVIIRYRKNLSIQNYSLSIPPSIAPVTLNSNYKYLAFTYDRYKSLARDATNLKAWYKMENLSDSSGNGFNLIRAQEYFSYPPVRNFTAATTTVSGQPYGNGTYVVSYSSAEGSWGGFSCFNTNDPIGGSWTNGYTNGTYNGTQSFDGGTYKGDWLKIQLPVSIKLNRYSFLQRIGFATRAPNDFKIYGSTNNTTWDVLVDKRTISYSNNMYEETVNIQNFYTYYLLVVNKLVGGSELVLNFDEWYIYGTESGYDPLISTDNGILENKYLLLDTANKYVNIPLELNISYVYNNVTPIGGSEIGITFSLWFKATSGSAAYSRIFDFSNKNVFENPDYWITICKESTSNNISFYNSFYNSNPATTYTTSGTNFYDGTWRHLCWCIDGGGKWYIYINGSIVSNGVYTSPIQATTTYTRQYIGKSPFGGNGYKTGGGVEDFRIYNVALTGAEVSQLYTFENTKSYTVNFPNPSGTLCDILVVGGGGSGGVRDSGGGGGGGVVLRQNYLIPANTTSTIYVGKGGNFIVPGQVSNDGINSSITIGSTTLTALGGGGGGGNTGNLYAGKSGGSGGGAAFARAAGSGLQPTSASGGYGNSGSGGFAEYTGGGGGGAGSEGKSDGNYTTGRTGGDGINMSAIFGTDVGHQGWFAGGGGSGGDLSGAYGNGGIGKFGGASKGEPSTAVDALPNTGGGGGSVRSGWNVGDRSGGGGSGIVLVRYYNPTLPITYPTLPHNTIDSTYNYITFTYGYQSLVRDSANLKAWYKMEDTLDSSGNGFHLTLQGATISIDDGILANKYLVLDGANKYADIPLALNIYDIYNNATAIGGSEKGISFSMWFKSFPGSGSYSRIFEFSNNNAGTNPTNHVLLAKNGTSTEVYIHTLGSNGNVSYSISGINFFDGNWRHICWCVGSDNKWYIYINGSIVLNGTVSLAIPNATYTRQTIGKGHFTGDGYNTGAGVEDFRIYNVALTATEVSQLYNNANQNSYSVNFPETEETLCDILVVGGGGAGGGNGQGGGGGAGSVIYYKDLILKGQYNIKVGNGGYATNNQNYGNNGSDSEFVKINNTQRFLAKGGGGGGTWGTSGFLAVAGGSGGGGGGTSTGASLVSGNIINDVNINFANNNYVNTGYIGNIGINSLNDTGCFGNKGGDAIGPEGSIGSGGGGAGQVGFSTIEQTTGDNKDTAGDGGSGKVYNITGVAKYYGGGGGGGLRPYGTAHGSTSVVGIGGKGGGGNGGGAPGTNSVTNDGSSGFDGENGTGGGGGGVGGYTPANYRGGRGGSGVVIIRYRNRNALNYMPQWTYNTLNANTYYYGNVGIGNTNPLNALHINGSIYSTNYSAGSKTFIIEHPLKINKMLYHGCLEGPRFDNIYRGEAKIINGKAVVDIDKECNTTGGMSLGTFCSLNKNHQLYLQNNETYDSVIGYIDDNKIIIRCENEEDEINIIWLVIGERCDKHIINARLTNIEGSLICEHDS